MVHEQQDHISHLEDANSKKVQTVFITGGTGFIGAYIIKCLLERGFKVRALRRSKKNPFFIPQEFLEKVEWFDGDILDVVSLEEGLHGMDAVIHSAAMVSFRKSERERMYKINIDGTENVVNAAIENSVKRFIHISSVAAIGRVLNEGTVNEEKKWEQNKNNTHYAVTKYEAEVHAWRGYAEGLTGVILNPSTVLGFGDWHQSSCAIFRNVYNEFEWYTKGINGFVGVEDVADITVQMLAADINERRFIINSENWSFEKLFTTIAKGFNKKPPHKLATAFMGEVAWRMENIKSLLTNKKPLLTQETAKVAQSRTHFSNEAILDALPSFAFTPLEDVIKNSCEKYLEAVRKGHLKA